MGTFTNNDSIKKICDAILSNSCIAFIGSGLSAAVKLPTWNQLLDGLVSKINNLEKKNN